MLCSSGETSAPTHTHMTYFLGVHRFLGELASLNLLHWFLTRKDTEPNCAPTRARAHRDSSCPLEMFRSLASQQVSSLSGLKDIIKPPLFSAAKMLFDCSWEVLGYRWIHYWPLASSSSYLPRYPAVAAPASPPHQQPLVTSAASDTVKSLGLGFVNMCSVSWYHEVFLSSCFDSLGRKHLKQAKHTHLLFWFSSMRLGIINSF